MWQLVKFGCVGVFSNTLMYLMYLGLTGYGSGHKTALTLVYVLGTMNSFFLNKRITFQHRGSYLSSSVKFGIAYFIGYLLNILALYVCVDLYQLPHQWVQLCMIGVVAVVVFTLQKLWVFSEAAPSVVEKGRSNAFHS